MERQELESIVRASFDAGLLVDEGGRAVFVNRAAKNLFGINEDESLQKNFNVTDVLVLLDPRKPNGTPMMWNQVKRIRQESIAVLFKTTTTNDADTDESSAGHRRAGEARLAHVGTSSAFSLLFLRPTVSNAALLATSMVEASLDPVFSIDEEGTIQMVNSAACRLFGFTEQEFVGSNISRICGGLHGEQHDDYISQYLTTNQAKVMGKRRKLPARRKDGSEFVIELSVVEIKNDGNGQHLFCGYVRDLTEQRQLLSKVEHERNVNASVLDAALDPLFQVDEHGIIKMVNEAATRKFGWTKEEFVGSNVSMIVGPEHASKHDSYMDRYLRTGQARVMGTQRELPARRKDGSIFPIRLSLVEVKVKNGDDRLFCGFVHDLTEQKAFLAKIEQERTLVTGIINAALDPLFQINEKGVIEMVNDAATKQFGWTKEEFLGSNISMICGGTHGARHGQYMERYLRTGETRVMGTKRELPARRKDGSEFPIQLSLVEVKCDDKRMFCGFVFDLTEQKAHMNEIERRESFTNKIIEGSYDAMVVTDKNGKITRINDMALRKFGCGSDKLYSLTIFSLLSPDDAKWLEDEIEQYLTAEIPIETQKEVEGVQPNTGATFPALIGVSELEGPDGAPHFAVYLHDLTERKRTMQVEAEKAAAEYLLFNMLPENIAGKLKDDPSHIAESHNFAAVLFADIVGFTSMSSMMEPHEVVSMLNELFSMFDDVVEQYGLNKVKTIGDCYMVTSVPGIVGDEKEHCRRVCHFGLDMIDTLQKYNTGEGSKKLNLRVGINCGPVVAGVVGTKRFLYDLWGDAVNLASRMESTGVPGKVQTPSHVAALMKDDFSFEKRGTVNVKGKGEMETYFLTGRKAEFETAPEKPQRRSRMLLKTANVDYLRESLRTFEASLLSGLDDVSDEESSDEMEDVAEEVMEEIAKDD